VTHLKDVKKATYQVEGLTNSSLTHFTNFVESAKAGKPENVNCSPELGAAAMVIVKLGSKSYREGKAFHFDSEKMLVSDGNGSWAERWEKLSKERGSAKHIPGWKAGDLGSTIKPHEYQKLAGPWIDGVDPAANVEVSTPAAGKNRRRNKARS
jgi:hypothetical protein